MTRVFDLWRSYKYLQKTFVPNLGSSYTHYCNTGPLFWVFSNSYHFLAKKLSANRSRSYHIPRKYLAFDFPKINTTYIIYIKWYLNKYRRKLNSRPCNFTQHALCAAEIIGNYQWSDRNICPIGCKNQEYHRASIEVNIGRALSIK